MAYVIAKKRGKEGSVAYIYNSDDIPFITKLEETYFNQDIDIVIASTLSTAKEFLPTFNVGHPDLFIETIHNKLTN